MFREVWRLTDSDKRDLLNADIISPVKYYCEDFLHLALKIMTIIVNAYHLGQALGAIAFYMAAIR